MVGLSKFYDNVKSFVLQSFEEQIEEDYNLPKQVESLFQYNMGYMMNTSKPCNRINQELPLEDKVEVSCTHINQNPPRYGFKLESVFSENINPNQMVFLKFTNESIITDYSGVVALTSEMLESNILVLAVLYTSTIKKDSIIELSILPYWDMEENEYYEGYSFIITFLNDVNISPSTKVALNID